MRGNGFRKARAYMLAGVMLAGILLFGHGAAAAAVNLGLTPEVGDALGLGTQDLRVTVATIIRNFMGLLGIVAVALILYGGFLYMTSQGEEDRIDKAKKVIISAAIGLGIVLSAVAISQFVIRMLVDATGATQGGGGSGYGGGAGGGLPPGSFFVKDISPSSEVPIRNIVVRIMLSLPIDASTAASNVAVIGPNGSVSGTVSTYGDLIEFEPNSACPDPNGGLKCFAENADYTVMVSSGLKGNGGESLQCGGLAPPCSANFRSGDQVDVTAPDPVAITSPDDGQSIPEGTATPIQVHAVDDVAISYVEAFVDGTAVGKDSPGAIIKDFLADVLWSDTVTLGEHSLSAQAHDVDKHLTGSESIGVVVRPLHCFNKKQDVDETDIDCGGSCGSCGGGACVKDSDCASGLCIAGICIDRPRIDSVTPVDQADRPNGAPGTYVTLSGAFFGSSIGTVTFVGSATTTAQTADLCDNAAWSDTEITVKVPDAAIDGPIVVTASSGQADATNDQRGPILNDFDVNTTVHPGICNLSPRAGEPGTAVTMAGTGFGQTQGNGDVKFRLGSADTSVGNLDAASWSDSQVSLNVPSLNVQSSQVAMVRLTQGGTDSNSKQFAVDPLGAGKAPRIDAIDPEIGPVGQYVSILGVNFGGKVGTVLFTLPDQTTAVGATDFPPLCGTDFWKDTSVTVKVPAYYKDGVTPIQEVPHMVRVRRADGVESNLSPFNVVPGAAGPGICALIPDNGPASTTKVDVIGERFGTIVGEVRFADDALAPDFTNWGDTMLSKVRVPGVAKTGLVRVKSAGSQDSNGVNYLVASCSDSNQCSVGYSCCGDGSCRKDCAGVSLTGAFAWRFSTGEIPHLPQMIEQLTCTDSTQSPSPYKGTNDACANAVVSGRIDADMDDPSLVANVAVYRCGDGDSFDPATCSRDVTIQKASETIVTPVGPDEDLFTYTPAALEPGRWYEAVVRSNPATTTPFGAKSVDGLYLDGDFDGLEGGDYVWRFKVRDDGTACAVDHVEVTPSDYLLEAKNAKLGYRADPTAANCNLLQCSSYSWLWTSVLSDTLQSPGDPFAPLVPIPGQPACVRQATALQETPPGIPVRESATLTQFQASDYGNLAISYKKPEVVSYWPACAGACVNAGVGLRWNVGMDTQTLNKSNIRLCECTEESCTKLVSCSDTNPAVSVALGAPEIDAQGVEHIVEAYLSGLPVLKKQTWYRVLVRGTAAGVRSESGGELLALNYGPNYSWKFRTRDDAALCEVDTVKIEPKEGTVYVYGDVLPYQSTPVSKGDDKCGPTPLNPLAYDWQWSTENVSALQLPEGEPPGTLVEMVAAFDFGGTKDFMPLKVGPGCSAMCLNVGSVAGDSVCGNGTVERGEDCDDGGIAGNDGCSPICLAEGSAGGAVCGNGAIERGTPGSTAGARGENCDDGNAISGDGCSARCLAEGSAFGAAECGNAKKDTGESCDDGNLGSGDGCGISCVLEGSTPGKSVCGDGQVGIGESCDDSNSVSGDGCSDKCLREGAGSAGGCSNGTVDVGEECDDGNMIGGDGCGATCLLEITGSPQCQPGQTVDCCGDGTVSPNERCDSGILADANANCNPTKCTWLGLAACANPGLNSTNLNCCGNGAVEKGETCDDGNLSSNDGCGNKCFLEGSIPVSICGDSMVGRDEDCDDSNAAGGDGCSAICLAEGTSVLGSVCGNGDIGKGETCDDGNNSSGDGCSASCLNEGAASAHPVCGNGTVEKGEDCDDSNGISGDGCSERCLAEGSDRCLGTTVVGCCGNALVEVGENCDDGGQMSGDGCSERCLMEGSNARYNLMGQSSSYCGYPGDVAPPSQFGTGEMCEWTASGDGNSDPLQFVRSRFGGEAKIMSSVENPVSLTTVEGSGKFTLFCQCSNDLSCSRLVPGGSMPPNGVGCGIGKCCYGRPYPESVTPPNSSVGACRNAYIAATWDRVMDKGTFASSTFLLVKKTAPSLPCDPGADLPMVPTLGGIVGEYCLASSTPAAVYSVSGIEVPVVNGNGENSGNVVTELTVQPKSPLDPNSVYGVLIYGDHDLDDDVTEGVASAAKVAMDGDYFWNFTTGAEICKLDHIGIAPATWLFSTAQNDPSDDLPGPLLDSVADSDKRFVADAYAKVTGGAFEKISPVAGYSWVWAWTSSDVNNDRLASLAAGNHREQTVKTVVGPKNGRVTLTATAAITADLMGTLCAADSECGAGGACVEPLPGLPKTCSGKVYSATSEVTVLLCENPWPARSQFGGWKPFTDDQGGGATNFSTYYCRDQGKVGTSDDLPAPATGEPISVSHVGDRVCSNDVTVACAQDSDCPKAGAVCQPKFVRDFLFPLLCSNGLCNPGDAFGFRVMPNYEHQELKKWYALQGFGGSPAEATVDGYRSLSDGRTVYVSAANKVGDPDIYTNVYLLSYNEGASQNTRKVATLLGENWNFNTNAVSTGICREKVCSLDKALSCVSDADCGTDKGTCGPLVCSSDDDCGGAGGVCNAIKDKLRRDVGRYVDFREIEAGLETYRTQNLRCSKTTARACLADANCPAGEHCVGDYPSLTSGAFVRGASVSIWDSWKNALGEAVGVRDMPTDPLNKLVCDTDGGYDGTTCFNGKTSTYMCLPGSHAYQYRKTGKSYTLSTEFEYKVCSDDGDKACRSSSDCQPTGTCVAPVWKGAGPATHVEYDDVGNAYTIDNAWTIENMCGQAIGGTSSVCGDGVVGPSEECEPGATKLVQCVQGNYPGYATVTCVATGPSACAWGPVVGCSAGFCGDGIVQPTEVCDDGSMNGTYGHCETSCKKPAMAGHCGDGVVQGVEDCDLGGHCRLASGTSCSNDSQCPAAGDWCVGVDKYSLQAGGQSCSFDCKSAGPSCGDKKVQAEYGEECDGNTGVDTEFCPVCKKPSELTAADISSGKYANCTDATIDRKQVRIRNCGLGTEGVSSCKSKMFFCSQSPQPCYCDRCDWLDWGECNPVGVCSDGVTDPGEECDDGNDDNTDGCVIVKKYDSAKKIFVVDTAVSCKKATCGDNYVWNGIEACDTGAKNVNPSDKPRIQTIANSCPYGKICSFCTTACQPAAVSGGYCGDLNVTPSYEMCEPGLGKGNYGGDPVLAAKYAGVDQICYPNCQSFCPPDMQTTPGLQLVKTLQSPNYVPQVDAMKSNDPWYLAVPPCRYLEGINAELDFQNMEKPTLDVMIVMDVSKDMEKVYTGIGGGGQQKIVLARQFASTLVSRLGQEYSMHQGKLQIGVLTAPSLDPVQPVWNESASWCLDHPNTCCKQSGWADKDANGAAVFGDSGYCWMTPGAKQSMTLYPNGVATNVTYCGNFICSYESTMRSPAGMNDSDDELFLDNAGDSVTTIANFLGSGSIKPIDKPSDLPAAIARARQLLKDSSADKKLLVVVTGRDSGSVCGGSACMPGETPSPSGFCSPPSYILHLENTSSVADCFTKGEGYVNTQDGTTIYYGYKYDEANKLVDGMFKSVSTVNLTFNGKSTEIVPGGILKLDLNGLKCDSKERRVELKVDWGGDGFIQVKNVTPSYCPVIESLPSGSTGLGSGLQGGIIVTKIGSLLFKSTIGTLIKIITP